MGYEDETMVQTPDEPETDDFSVDDLVEEVEEASESIESVLGGGEQEEEAQANEQPEEQAPKAKEEPGYVRGRIDKAVQKAVAETEARMRAEFEAQMAPFKAKMMEDEAQALVQSRKIADIETAREFVRMKNGQPAAVPAAPKPVEQPRKENGQYAPKEDPVVSARVSMLDHQAKRIMARDGIDVTAEFMNNPEIKQKVIAGEMDFEDVAEQIKQQPKRRPPSPMRSPNGASVTNPNSIMNMTDEQFERLEKRIQQGARIRLE